MPRWCLGILFAIVGAVLASSSLADEPPIDLTHATVVRATTLAKPQGKAVEMLLDEVEKRTQIRWDSQDTWPKDAAGPIIAVGTAEGLKTLAGDQWHDPGKLPGREGYQIHIDRGGASPIIWVIGTDGRGVLYGVGRLLRTMSLRRQNITLPADFSMSTAPQTALRGHQLGYRPKTNSYDGWTVAMWEQYLRDLAIFGCNSIELIPPRSDDASDGPMFPLPQMRMMTEVSRLADEYGMDVWVWYPAMDRDYSNPATVQSALKEWGEVFRKLPRLDAVFVPGGDPGHTRPVHFMALLEKQTENLHQYHPHAQMWLSPQSFNRQWFDEFIGLMNQQPAWLSGIVYGPQIIVPLHQLREVIPKRYPIRHYPDITHSLRCQYPVPDWDLAFAMTEAREPINPRPMGMARIYRLTSPDVVGFITYSEGCNDDVNKAVWSALGWDANADVTDILRDYSRYFISPDVAEGFAQGLISLEKNWQGPALTNANIATTLAQFREMEKSATPQMKLNWRFQQALYRAYYDAYVRDRLIHETDLEHEALAELRRDRKIGSSLAVSRAQAILDRAVTQRPSPDLRARVFELGEALFQSVRMQLSVPRYHAISVGRGANLDEIDVPLNNRLWLEQQFAELPKIDSESGRLKRLDEILNWTNPGPGGFYDDLGNLSCQLHLLRGVGWENDPAFYHSTLVGFGVRSNGGTALPISWWRCAESLFDEPLRMHYEHLDPKSQYKLRIVYGRGEGKVRLLANDQIEIHPYTSRQLERLEFDIPPEATASGKLDLAWHSQPGQGGNGLTFQVAEVWLMRK